MILMLLSSSSFFFFFSLLPRPESGWHTFLSDGLHLTAAGNAFVFERLVEVIDAKHAEFKVRRVVTIHPYKQTNKQTDRQTDRQTIFFLDIRGHCWRCTVYLAATGVECYIRILSRSRALQHYPAYADVRNSD